MIKALGPVHGHDLSGYMGSLVGGKIYNQVGMVLLVRHVTGRYQLH
jgi:hypothetical protein